MKTLHMTINSRSTSGSFLLASLLALPSTALAQRYELVGIGTFYRESRATGLNNHGRVVGWSPPPGGGPDQAVVWEDRELILLGPGYARGVNDVGHVVGRNPDFLAVIWKWGQPIVIGTLDGYSNSVAVAINNQNQVACNATGSLGRRAAFLWEDEIFRELGTLGGAHCEVVDINNLTEIVGKSSTPSGLEHAFLWRDGVMTDLRPLDGHNQSYATAVNDHGVVVGSSFRDSETTPCIWINGEPEALPRLGGDRWTTPIGINRNGVIVGIASSIELNERAVIWRDNTIVDLNDYAFGEEWVLESALDINDQGWIVGVGTFEGFKQGYVLIPMPTLDADPLFAGQSAEFRMRDGAPDARAFLAYSPYGFGSTRIPLLGIELDLHRPALAASGRTDATGAVNWTLNIPPGARGLRVLFQAAQVSRTSNVVVRIIE